MKITICVSVGSLNTGLDRLLKSVNSQDPKPNQILTEAFGTIPQSRNKTFKESTGDILVFVDTDQETPKGWLKKITDPIINNTADYVCGPTRPHPKPLYQSKYNDYFAEIEKQHYYSICKYDQSAFPSGNSAWHRKVFEEVVEKDGYLFDDRFRWGGEDYDVNIRATEYGFKGLFVPEAWVWHDQSSLNSAFKIIKRKAKYCKGGAMAHVKNKTILNRLNRECPKFKPYRHWLELFQPLAQITGLIRGKIEVMKWKEK